MTLVGLYLAIIVVANLLVYFFGQPVLVVTAVALVPVDFAIRTRLQERWKDDRMWIRLLLLLMAGGVLTVLTTPNAHRVAIASVSAFSVSSLCGTIIYASLSCAKPWRRAWSLTGMALADSVVFPWIAFDVVSSSLIMIQAACKAIVSIGVMRMAWLERRGEV